MKRSYVISTSLAASAALLLGPAAGIAFADTQAGASGADLSLQPASGTPGSKVVARLSCLNTRHIEPPAIFNSGRVGAAAGSVYYNYTVSSDAKPGQYVVNATCGDEKLQATYTVHSAQTWEWPVLRHGSTGVNVKALQDLLNGWAGHHGIRHIHVTGVYHKSTVRDVRRYQRAHHLHVDGVVGPNTWGSMTTRFQLRDGARGHFVKALQEELRKQGEYGGHVDGIWGPLTDRAVRSFQSDAGLSVDGIVGPKTWRALITTGNND